MVDLDALIEKQRQAVTKPKTAKVDISLGGQLVEFQAARLLPGDWQQLVAAHPLVGFQYNKATLPPEYPATKITIDGDDVSAEKWATVWSLLEVPDRELVDAILWGLNYFDAYKELQHLGKVEAARRSNSPAPKASRRAASKAGSQRKSPATTPRKVS